MANPSDANAFDGEALASIISASVTQLVKGTGLPDDMFKKLSEEEDDWTFIVKGHALLETAVNDLAVNALGKELLRTFIETELDMSHRIKIAKALLLLPAPYDQFLEKFGVLRNVCAHQARQLAFSLKAYLQTLDKNQEKAFFKTVTLDSFLLADRAAFRDNPRPVLAQGLEATLGFLTIVGTCEWLRHRFAGILAMCPPRGTALQGIWKLATFSPPYDSKNMEELETALAALRSTGRPDAPA